MTFGVKLLDYTDGYLRHSNNIMIDLYRRPNEIKQVVEVIAILTIKFLRMVIPPLVESELKFFGFQLLGRVLGIPSSVIMISSMLVS